MRRGAGVLLGLAVAATSLAACGGGAKAEPTTTTISVKPANREAEACQLRASAGVARQGRITIATATPAYEPWFSANDPANGMGFESGLAYDLAARLGFKASAVRWIALPFAAITAKGKRPFDLALSEVPADVDHARSIELSKPYWANPGALVAMRGSTLAKVSWSTLAGERHPVGWNPLLEAKLGVVAGSAWARFVRDVVKPSALKRYPDLDAAAKALRAGKVDGVVAALPDAWLMARSTKGAALLGRLGGSGEGFVVAVARQGIPVECVNLALASLKADGTTAELSRRYLGAYRSAPLLWTYRP